MAAQPRSRRALAKVTTSSMLQPSGTQSDAERRTPYRPLGRERLPDGVKNLQREAHAILYRPAILVLAPIRHGR